VLIDGKTAYRDAYYEQVTGFAVETRTAGWAHPDEERNGCDRHRDNHKWRPRAS